MQTAPFFPFLLVIAISYRRDDSLPIAGRLYDRLEQQFGRQNVFMDFDSIRPGFDFRDQIKETIERSKVVIAIIGPHWLGEQDDGSRRIDYPTDFVRLEVAHALQRGIPVIPVLLNDTPMPASETLPSDIQALAFRHALPLDSGLDFHQHAERLVMGIQGIIGKKGGRRSLTTRHPKHENADAPIKSPGGQKNRVLFTGFVILLTAAVVSSAWFWGRRLVEETARELAATEATILPPPSAAIERPETAVSDTRGPVVSATAPPSLTSSNTVRPLETTTPAQSQQGPGENAGPTRNKVPGFSDVDLLLSQKGPIRPGTKLSMSHDELFSYDGADLQPSAMSQLQKLASLLKRYPKATFSVEGYTDSLGEPDYNLDLTLRRAESVKQYLIDVAGMNPAQIQTRGYGSSKFLVAPRPVAVNSPEEQAEIERQRPNRRIVIVVHADTR